MKVLYECFSCSPYYGSDEGIGWMWPFHMRKYHQVWVLVRKDRRKDIERYCLEKDITDVNFIYCDIPNWMNFYYKNKLKGKNGTLDFLLYQWLWQFPALKAARKADKEFNFDIIHHAATNDFRLLGRLYKLKKPYIIGPIGGAQKTPAALNYYVRNNKKNEKLRILLNKFFTSTLSYRKALKYADKIYFSNKETFDYLRNIINDKNKCDYLTEIGCSEIGEYVPKMTNKRITFMWAGRMEYRKGLEFLFDVLETLPKNDKWKVLLVGEGTQKDFYEKLAEKKRVENYVNFTGKLSYESVSELYNKSDVFVFPSLRETTGSVVVEAMAHGLPVVCLKHGGAVNIINERTGILVDGKNRVEYINNFSNAMLRFIEEPEMHLKMGKSSYNRIKDCYTWEKKVFDILSVYDSIIH